MKSILALDVSKSGTGWAFGLPAERPMSGLTKFGSASHTDDEVWRTAMVWLNGQMQTLQPAIVAIEAAIMSSAPGQGGFTNPQTQAVLIGLQAVLRTVVKARLPGAAVLVAASSSRKTFTGRGTFPSGEAKRAVQAEVLRRGWLDEFDMQADRADALCLWGHMAAQQMPELAFHQPKAPRKRVEA